MAISHAHVDRWARVGLPQLNNAFIRTQEDEFFLIEALSLWDDIHLEICLAPIKKLIVLPGPFGGWLWSPGCLLEV